MQIVFEKNSVLKTLSFFKRVSPAISANPVLQGTLFEVDGTTITLTAYNMQIGVKTTIPSLCLNNDKGSFVVNTSQLYDIVTKMGDEINLDYNGEECILHSKNATYTISTIKGSDFPDTPSITGEITNFSVEDFLTGVEKTVYAAMTSELKQNLLGLNISTKDNYLSFEAIDGYRLAKFKKDIGYKGNGFSLTVKKDILNIVVNILEKSNAETLSILKEGNHVLFKFDDYEVFCLTLCSDNFNLEQHLPKESPYLMTVNRGELIDSVETVTPTVEAAERNPIIITMQPSGSCVFETFSNIGKSKNVLETHIEGLDKEMVISFNVKFLLEALKNIGCETVDLLFSNAVNPVIIRDHEDSNSWALVLPVRLRR